jgi:hypothetical protein
MEGKKKKRRRYKFASRGVETDTGGSLNQQALLQLRRLLVSNSASKCKPGINMQCWVSLGYIGRNLRHNA